MKDRSKFQVIEGGRSVPPDQQSPQHGAPSARPNKDERLYDNAHIRWSVGQKNEAREVIRLYRELEEKKTGSKLGWKAIRNLIMKDADQRARDAHEADLKRRNLKPDQASKRERCDDLSGDHFQKWCEGDANLGDRKFQYVDRFLTRLQFCDNRLEIRALLRQIRDRQMKTALSPYIIQSEDGPKTTHAKALLEGRILGILLSARPTAANRSDAQKKRFKYAYLLLFYFHVFDQTFVPLDISLTDLGYVPNEIEPSFSDFIDQIEISSERTLCLYSGFATFLGQYRPPSRVYAEPTDPGHCWLWAVPYLDQPDAPLDFHPQAACDIVANESPIYISLAIHRAFRHTMGYLSHGEVFFGGSPADDDRGVKNIRLVKFPFSSKLDGLARKFAPGWHS